MAMNHTGIFFVQFVHGQRVVGGFPFEKAISRINRTLKDSAPKPSNQKNNQCNRKSVQHRESTNAISPEKDIVKLATSKF